MKRLTMMILAIVAVACGKDDPAAPPPPTAGAMRAWQLARFFYNVVGDTTGDGTYDLQIRCDTLISRPTAFRVFFEALPPDVYTGKFATDSASTPMQCRWSSPTPGATPFFVDTLELWGPPAASGTYLAQTDGYWNTLAPNAQMGWLNSNGGLFQPQPGDTLVNAFGETGAGYALSLIARFARDSASDYQP